MSSAEIAFIILLSGPVICAVWMVISLAKLLFGKKVERVPAYVIDKSTEELSPMPRNRRNGKLKSRD